MREPRLWTSDGEIPFSALPTEDLKGIISGEFPFVESSGDESGYQFGILYAKILLSERP